MTVCDNPLLTITDFVDYAAVRPEHVAPAVTALCEDVEKTLLTVLDTSRPATWENVVEPLNESLGRLTRACWPPAKGACFTRGKRSPTPPVPA